MITKFLLLFLISFSLNKSQRVSILVTQKVYHAENDNDNNDIVTGKAQLKPFCCAKNETFHRKTDF